MSSQKLSTKKRITILLVWCLLLMRVLLIGEPTLAMYQNPYTVLTTVVVITVCGNGVKESGEDCDGADLNGATCVSQGYVTGTLTCRPSCEFNTTNCSMTTGGGSPGGGGFTVPVTVPTTVIFTGMAYPDSQVSLLKDGQLAASAPAGGDANFYLSLSGLGSGNYVFSLYSQDRENNQSNLLTFPISVTAGAITKVSGVFISPTIIIDQPEVVKGDNLAIMGQTLPKSQVVISVHSEIEQFFEAKSNNAGIYFYNLDTSFLALGSHLTKAKSVASQGASQYSRALGFTVMAKGADSQEPRPKDNDCERSDYNCDARINLVDFSIAAYWYKRAKPPASVDLNKDGKVDLVDFSILAYNWTG